MTVGTKSPFPMVVTCALRDVEGSTRASVRVQGDLSTLRAILEGEAR